MFKYIIKRFLILLIILTTILSANIQLYAIDENEESNTSNLEYISKLSELISKYDNDNYFQTMYIPSDSTNIIIDGNYFTLNTSSYIEDGKMMVSATEFIKTVDFENTYNTEDVIASSVNEVVPIREIAKSLDCEVEWDNDTKTAIITRPLQTKRLIVYNEDIDDSSAVESIKGNDFTILQFNSIADTKSFIDNNPDLKIEPDYIQNEPSNTIIQSIDPIEKKYNIVSLEYLKSNDFLSWGTKDIGVQEFYEQTKIDSEETVVAIIDSGIQYNHPYFEDKIVNGWDIYYNDNYCEDSFGHGSHVASIVLDVAGVNPDVKVMPIKVFGDSRTTTSTIVAAGIDYAVQRGVDVINLSLGGEYKSEIEQKAINNAISHNIAVIAAAGNKTLDLTKNDYSPATLDNVITVSAINKNESLCYFSNYGENIIDFAAPGMDIIGVDSASDGFVGMSGTSMAAPHVSGVYALFISTNKGISINNITALLKNVAKKKDNKANYGAGIIRLTNLELTPLTFELSVKGKNIDIHYIRKILVN